MCLENVHISFHRKLDPKIAINFFLPFLVRSHYKTEEPNTTKGMNTSTGPLAGEIFWQLRWKQHGLMINYNRPTVTISFWAKWMVRREYRCLYNWKIHHLLGWLFSQLICDKVTEIITIANGGETYFMINYLEKHLRYNSKITKYKTMY